MITVKGVAACACYEPYVLTDAAAGEPAATRTIFALVDPISFLALLSKTPASIRHFPPSYKGLMEEIECADSNVPNAPDEA